MTRPPQHSPDPVPVHAPVPLPMMAGRPRYAGLQAALGMFDSPPTAASAAHSERNYDTPGGLVRGFEAHRPPPPPADMPALEYRVAVAAPQASAPPSFEYRAPPPPQPAATIAPPFGSYHAATSVPTSFEPAYRDDQWQEEVVDDEWANPAVSSDPVLASTFSPLSPLRQVSSSSAQWPWASSQPMQLASGFPQHPQPQRDSSGDNSPQNGLVAFDDGEGASSWQSEPMQMVEGEGEFGAPLPAELQFTPYVPPLAPASATFSLPSFQLPARSSTVPAHHSGSASSSSSGGNSPVLTAHRTTSEEAAATAAGLLPPVAKKACIPCRKLKASCDNGRPCSRCVKFGRECIDRTEEELEAAKQRRKRRPGLKQAAAAAAATVLPPILPPKVARATTTATAPKSRKKKPTGTIVESMPPRSRKSSVAAANVHSPILPHRFPTLPFHSLPPPVHGPGSPTMHRPRVDVTDPSSYALSFAATEEASRQLYSRSMLAILRECDMRHLIFSTHILLNSLDVPLAALLHWNTQAALLMTHLADQLTPEDLVTFAAGPDGHEQHPQQHPAWENSPLAPWTRLATRPLFYAIQPAMLDEPELMEEDFNGIVLPSIVPIVQNVSASLSPSLESATTTTSAGSSGEDLTVGIGGSIGADAVKVTDTALPAGHPWELNEHTPVTPIHLLPQMQVEWLPESNRAFQRWQRMMAQRLLFESNLRGRQRGTTMNTDSATNYAQDLVLQMQLVDSAVDRSSLRAQLKDLIEHAAAAAEANHTVAPSMFPEAAPGQEEHLLDHLCDSLSCLDIGRSLSAQPGPERPEDAVGNFHATWCPHGSPRLWPVLNRATTSSTTSSANGRTPTSSKPHGGHGHKHPHPDNITEVKGWPRLPMDGVPVKREMAQQGSAKIKRVEGMDSVHAHQAHPQTPDSPFDLASTGSSASATLGGSEHSHEPALGPCVCALSTGLPTRLRVNAAFARCFGLGLDDVRHGFGREGVHFLRRLYPPTAWPQLQRSMISHSKAMLQFVGQVALHGAVRENPHKYTLDDPMPLPPPSRPDFEPMIHTSVHTATGAIRPCTMRKCVRVRHATDVDPANMNQPAAFDGLASDGSGGGNDVTSPRRRKKFCTCDPLTSAVTGTLRECQCASQPVHQRQPAALVLTWDVQLGSP